MTDFDPILHVNIFLHAVPPDRFFNQLKELDLRIGGYMESMCMVSINCPASLIYIIEQHRDVMRIKITTAPFILRKMKEEWRIKNE